MIGAGAGLNVKGADQLHFVHVGRPAGDFEVVVRLAGLAGEGDARAGIMARADGGASAAMATVSFQVKDNGLGWMSRIPGGEPSAPPRLFSGGIQLANKPPLWLRMVRRSKDFAVYKSRDGRLWSMISNVSGGPIVLDGPVQLGVFVSSGVEGKTATASFDSIATGGPQMRYKTSWVGNTFGSREEDKYVSNTISAMWVAPDGTCYTSSYWDEGGRPVTSYRDGRAARAAHRHAADGGGGHQRRCHASVRRGRGSDHPARSRETRLRSAAALPLRQSAGQAEEPLARQ